MTVFSRLGSRAAVITKFISDKAKEAQTNYILTGASALIVRGVIRRTTQDVDINIAPRKSAELQMVVKEYVDPAKNEGVLVDGKTEEEKARQTKFRIFKSPREFGVDAANMKIDVSEHESVLLPNAYTDIEGIQVATVPLMVVFKICALARQNRGNQAPKAATDAADLIDAVNDLISRSEVIPDDIQSLFAREQPPFSWSSFWDAFAAVYEDSPEKVVDLEHKLQALGVKTRD